MAEGSSPSSLASNLKLTPDEQRYFYQLFQSADAEKLGVVTGEVAVKFFEKTKLPPPILGEIWQIADTENRGLLTPSGFGVVLRLIGHAQAGRHPSPELALDPGPLPRFEGIAPAIPQQPTGQPPSSPQQGPGGIRIPPLTPDKANEYAGLFDKSGAQNGILSGESAKIIFERARLPNETLGRIWNLADTQQRGQLDITEFIIAMHLIASFKVGALRAIPQTLPPGLYEAASRRGGATRQFTGSRPTSAGDVPPVPTIPRQFTGSPIPAQSPLARGQFATPLSAQSTGGDWLINLQEKAEFDKIFSTIDTAGRGFINGEQAVTFFSNSRLPEDVLAQIWDLADINSEGQLNRDEFAVAMFLIRQQRSKRDSRGVLPTTLPPNLIPPSMRRQHIPQTQPTAPTFDNAANITKPKSAADDLFGLDALSDPAPAQADPPSSQIPQSTGESTAIKSPASSVPQTSSPPPSTTFKPFIPSSNFGQSLQPNFSGSSKGAPPAASDDLLGDNDPEESRKLTPDTTELANLSNQVGTLSKQMQEVQTKRSTNEQAISQTAQQKRDFEVRLGQLRGLYEQEVREVKSLDERLAASRNEVKKLQQEMAMVEGSYHDLRTHHQEAAAALETEQTENASLKERIRQRNAEIAQVKPTLEKLRSDLRQQKGLVAINKKQLATLDQEHEKLKGEQESLTKEIEEEKRALAEAPVASPPPPTVTSPAPSTASQSTNPFFRRTTTGSSDQVTSPPAPATALSSEHQNAFDNLFGPSFAAPVSSTPPPPTSFRSTTPAQATDAQTTSAASSNDGAGITTPTMSPPQSTLGDSSQIVEPPPPPQSRQMTPSSLPLKDPIARPDSVSSSVKVSAPGSRFETSRADTPVGSTTGEPEEEKGIEDPPSQSEAYFGDYRADANEGQPSGSLGVPGAFPDDATPKSEAPPPRSAVAEGKQPEPVLADPFSGTPREQSRSPVAIRDDFDSAFNDLKPAQSSPNDSSFPTTNGATAASRKEFPDIQEFGDDESSDSESERGFDDNFTTASPPGKAKGTDGAADDGSGLQAPRPILPGPASTGNSLPGADAQTSPPTYQDSFPQSSETGFLPDFKGLLPSREDPTSPPAGAPHSVPESSGGSAPLPPSTDDDAPSTTGPKEPSKPSNGFDEFDEDAFGSLAKAKDGEDVEDFGTPAQTDDFDAAFDSPAISKSTPPGSTNNGHPSSDAFHDFETHIQPVSPALAKSPPPANNPSDWDAIFAGLDSSTTTAAVASDFPSPPASKSPPKDAIAPASVVSTPMVPPRPQPARAISLGTEHDDPILKRLTGMGYPREESLAALEKFDYNIDKAADYLTSK